MRKAVGIFGLGKSGRASAISYRNLGYDVFVWDDKFENVDEFDVLNVTTIDYKNWPWERFESLILAPGVPLIFPKAHDVVKFAYDKNVEIICDVEALIRHANKKARFIGITGTNGKSTTTALIYHVLRECGVNVQVGGNIGTPALEMDYSQDSVFVIETSSYQIDLLKKAKFDIAILLNITPDHLDRYGSFERYAQSKKEIFSRQTEDDVAIICVDQDLTQKIATELKVESRANLVTYVSSNPFFKSENFPFLPGEHNKQNIIAAFFAAKSCGLEDAKIIAAIKSFKGLDHRIKLVYENQYIKFINDSKATNAEATEPALKTFEDIYWLAGGVPKEGGIEHLKKYFPKIKHAFFYGEARNEFENTFRGSGFKNYNNVATFAEAFNLAARIALENGKADHKQSLVLLSPACASFDEFNNFEHRGKVFSQMALRFVSA
jgi:UDP-N-acetylmuramoylalanine--D-glutamate ligase